MEQQTETWNLVKIEKSERTPMSKGCELTFNLCNSPPGRRVSCKVYSCTTAAAALSAESVSSNARDAPATEYRC